MGANRQSGKFSKDSEFRNIRLDLHHYICILGESAAMISQNLSNFEGQIARIIRNF